METCKRVLHLTYTLDTGGAERVIANYVKFHNRRRYLPVVCSIKGGGLIANEIVQTGTVVYVHDKKLGFDVNTALLIRRVLQRESINIIHVHNPNPNLYGILASLLTSTNAIIRTEHNLFRKGRVMPGYPAVNVLLGLFNRRIIGVSRMVVESHQRKDPINRKKYLVVHNGIEDIIPSGDKKELINYIKMEFGIPEDAKVVGLVANIHKQKAVHFFLAAAEMILKRLPEAYFLIIGDGVLKKEMEVLSGSLGISQRVVFTGHRDDASRLISSMNVFALSSLWEGFPITILEAMRASVPCVVTDVGGNKEAVLHGKTGYLVPPGKPNVLAERIMALIVRPDLAEEMGKAGRRRFLEKFTASAMVEKTERIYDEVLGPH